MEDEEKVISVRSITDLHRLKIEKLMKNPEKLAFIPDKSRDKKFPDAPEFVRNVMGSSAGAGSGEFHVYRHIRRREYARQEHLDAINHKAKQDEEHTQKLDETRRLQEEKTSKKRAKRHKLKLKKKQKTSLEEANSDSDVDEELLKEMLEQNALKEKEIQKCIVPIKDRKLLEDCASDTER